jgi:hypothetical protein
VDVSLDDPVRRAEAVVGRKVAGEMLLVPIRTSPKEKVSVLTLNEVGAHVWEALGQPRTPRWLAEHVATEFEVGAERAGADVVAFLKRLAELGLVVEANPS